jgi:ABC-type polysaccharide/polyol phosphate transport system ATPase subunit
VPIKVHANSSKEKKEYFKKRVTKILDYPQQEEGFMIVVSKDESFFSWICLSCVWMATFMITPTTILAAHIS